ATVRNRRRIALRAVPAPRIRGRTMSLLDVTDLKVHFPAGGGVFRRSHGTVHAVDGVSFSVDEGEVVALVGESGCGKTTVARTILGLQEPSAGTIQLAGREATAWLAEDRLG